METDALVERERGERDTRQVFARITERGLARLADAAPTHVAGIKERFLGPLSKRQREDLTATWASILEPRREPRAGGGVAIGQ